MSDIIIGFVALAVACILVLDLAAQVHIRQVSEKLDQILARMK